MNPVCHLANWNLTGKRIVLRADLNVPIENGAITNDYRLRAIIPTIKLIQQKGGTIILISHIGRPKNADPKLSTRLLVPWFAQHGLTVTFAATPQAAMQLLQKTSPASTTQNQPPAIVLLENLRFFPGEKNYDQIFAQEVATLGDFYVNDAFGTLHREDTSVTLVPALFPPEKRSIGLLVERELHALDRLRTNIKKPFVAIIGGGKVADKLPLIQGLLSKVDAILLCPAIVFTFLKAQGKPVGKSLVDPTQLAACAAILTQAKKEKVAIHRPLDYQIAHDTITGPLSIVDADKLPETGIGISIGPKTIAAYTAIIGNAHTIFFNAAMGFASRPETITGTDALLKALAQAEGLSVVGGGDSVARVEKKGLQKIDYLSTGGGAALAYISGEKLPGLALLGDRTEAQ
ncbi:phosphoglycerate kinase [Candidatus Dependentiae bacterium HGW-Dependentiae-1]|nr:MAG: phosphoglycerate kinase [Candidatus Dependentiae bacterium HGW-Dependentiae-1]